MRLYFFNFLNSNIILAARTNTHQRFFRAQMIATGKTRDGSYVGSTTGHSSSVLLLSVSKKMFVVNIQVVVLRLGLKS